MTTLALKQAFTNHPRHWREFELVYPVISRRSRGLSVGINLSPGKACNFSCVYCCVDRTQQAGRVSNNVDLTQLRRELDAMLSLVGSGEIWDSPEFSEIPTDYRRLRDIAFSGDGEPTISPRFYEACLLAAEAKRAHRFFQARLVLITNGSRLTKPDVTAALTVLDANQGDVWVKLDAGTPEYFKQIDSCQRSYTQVLDNIEEVGKTRPLVLQSMFVKVNGEPTPPGEFAAYCAQVGSLMARGCRIKQIQLYTLARPAVRPGVEALSNEQLDQMCAAMKKALPRVACDVYYGA